MAPTKHDLGVLYLSGGGLAIVGGLVSYLWATQNSLVLVGIGSVIAASPLLAIAYVSVVCWSDDLPTPHLWRISQYFALGLGIATLVTLLVTVVRDAATDATLLPSLIVMLIGGGSAGGILLGLVVAFRDDHHKMRDLYERNSVMNRVLRHNIRNDMNVVLAHTEILADTVGRSHHTDVIQRKTNDVINLSRAARDVDRLHTVSDQQSSNLVPIVMEYLETIRENYPAATITYEGPDTAVARVDPLFRSVLDNLLENALVHNDEPIRIDVIIEVDEETVEVRVTDNGPGIPESQLEILDAGRERADHHGSGLGLWLVKWFVDRHDGELRFDVDPDRGSTVILRLPAADD